MSQIMDTQSKKVNIHCPECDADFVKEIEISIYQPDINIDLLAD